MEVLGRFACLSLRRSIIVFDILLFNAFKDFGFHLLVLVLNLGLDILIIEGFLPIINNPFNSIFDDCIVIERVGRLRLILIEGESLRGIKVWLKGTSLGSQLHDLILTKGHALCHNFML